jgi:hypothetical protein
MQKQISLIFLEELKAGINAAHRVVISVVVQIADMFADL